MRKLLLIFIFLAGALGVVPTANAFSYFTLHSISQGTQLNAITITFSVSFDCHNWIVYRDGAQIGATSVFDCNSGTRSFTDTVDLNNHTYKFVDLATYASVTATGWAKRVPDKTTGVSASQGTQYGKVDVSWSTTSLATGYDVYRSTSSGTKGNMIVSNTTDTSFSDTTVSGNTSYHYTVVAISSYGSAPDSGQAGGYGRLPDQVWSLSATQGSVVNAVQLNWASVADANNYKVYRANCSGCGLTFLGTSNNGVYTDYSTGAATAYYYKVSALVGSTEGHVGNEATGWGQYPAPSQVTDLSATQGTLYGKVGLSWSATSNATSYDIYWTGGYLTNVAGTSYTHDTSNDTHYNYVVVAKGPGGSAASSNLAEGWGRLPGQVWSLSATQGSVVNAVRLSWNGVADANDYKVYRASCSGCGLTFLGTSNNGTFNDWQAVSDTHYYYKVSAVVGSLEGPTGNEATGWQLIPPDQVTGVSATQGTLYGKIRITWPASARASSYDLYRSTSSGSKGSLIGSDLSATAYDDTGVTGTTGYYYTVVAKNAAGIASDSAQALGWGKVPAPVNTLTATEGTKNAKVTLTWASDQDATGYEVWRTTSSGGAATKIATLPAPSSGMDDTTVSGVSSYYYKVYALVGTMISAAGNEAEGWANASPTSATVTLIAGSTTPSDATSPVILDPNVTAGKPESYTIAITTPPATGTLTLQSNNFVYTPPADGLFSGDLTFAFTVTDKGGLAITGTGAIKVICPNPSIDSFTLTKSNILQASQFQSSGTFSLPACSKNGTVWVDVIDNNSAVVVGGMPIATANGTNLTKAFTSKGPVEPGSYTVRLTADSHAGVATKTATLTVTAVNLPTLSILPGLNVVAGQDMVMASLSKPGNANCPLTKDPAVATADPSKCYVMFATPPAAMMIDNTGTLPTVMGPIEADGSFPITGEVHKFDGTNLVKVGEVSQTVIAACNAPVILALNIPSLLPHEVPSYGASYKAFACSATLSGTLTIKQGGSIIDTVNLASLGYGAEAKATMIGTGLPEGTYTAELNISSAFGTDSKSQAFAVKPTPMPTLLVSPASVSEGEEQVVASIKPSDDLACPLTTDIALAQADTHRCYVELTTTAPNLISGTEANGLPTLTGYPEIAGDYTVQAVVSRWANGTRYDSAPLVEALKVTPSIPPVFKFTGKTEIYVAIDKLNLNFTQDSGPNCTLFEDIDKAKNAAGNHRLACIAEFTGDSGITKTYMTGGIRLSGTLTDSGIKTLAFIVKRVRSDGVASEVQTGDLSINVQNLPQPTITLKGGYKIGPGKYYVQKGQAITNANISVPGLQTSAKMIITVIDSNQSLVRENLSIGGSFWVNTPDLALLEERPVAVRVAWQDYPSVYSEQIITAVGGVESGMKLLIDAPQKTPDTAPITVNVKVGKYTRNGISYTPDTMGQWRIQILAQTDSQSAKTPVTQKLNAVNGEAEFQVNPAGNLFMKLTAVAELVHNINGLDETITSAMRYIEVVKGSAIEGTISTKSIDGPAPKTFAMNLEMTKDNRLALKEIAWEESSDGGVSWMQIPKSNTPRHNVVMQDPGERYVRAKMINKNTMAESYTPAIRLVAYATLDASIIAPSHVAPDSAVTLVGQLFRENVLTTNTINEWTIDAPSGKTTITGATATISDSREGKAYITLRTRPDDTRADDPYAWTIARHVLLIKTPTMPSVSAQGPRDIEIGKTYHYEGTVRPSWGGMVSLHTLKSEWALPNGSIVAGNTLDWTPGAQDLVDKKPLLFRAWVDGFKDSTTRETTISYVPWEYVWPTFTMSMKQQTVQAPSDLTFMVEHDQPAMNRRFEGLTYAWSFPNNVTGRQNDAFPNRASGQALFAGNYTVSVTIRDTRGHQTVLTQPIVTEQAAPYVVTLKVGKSNAFDRVPMTVTVRPTISGGHPLDIVTSQTWKVDGIPVAEYANRNYMLSDITGPGNHIISYTLNSRMGETTTLNSPIQLIANLLPVCQLKAVPNAYVVYAEAKCTDPDGKVIGYSWRVNGQAIGSSAYRVSFPKTNTPQSASVTITAMDDAHELSSPVSINVSY